MSISISSNQAKVEYPVLRKAVDSELVVLFTAEHIGVVLVASNLASWSFGQHYDDFTHSEGSNWIKVEGTIRG